MSSTEVTRRGISASSTPDCLRPGGIHQAAPALDGGLAQILDIVLEAAPVGGFAGGARTGARIRAAGWVGRRVAGHGLTPCTREGFMSAE